MDSTVFNIPDVLDRVEKRLEENGRDPEEIRDIFAEELFTWGDYYRENLAADSLQKEAIEGVEAVLQLWLEYAKFEISLNQYKKAVDVYENALSDTIVSKSLQLYLYYANFCIDRKKFGNAKKVFIRGLLAGLKIQDSDKLWDAFLTFMQKDNTSLNLEELCRAVKQQLNGNCEKLVEPSSIAKLGNKEATSDDINNSHITGTKRSLETFETGDAENKEPDSIVFDQIESKEPDLNIDPSQSFSSSSLHANKNSVSSSSLASNISSSPLPLLSESTNNKTDTMLLDVDLHFGMDRYDKLEEKQPPEQLIRAFCNRPPMLFLIEDIEPRDFSTLSIVEKADLENSLNCRLVPEEVEVKARNYLDILESMWNIQALKERHFCHWFQELEATKVDTKNIQNRYEVQKELLHAIVNKTLLNILVEQYMILINIGVIKPSTNVQSFLKNPQNNTKLIATDQEIGKHRRIVNSLLWVRKR